MMSKYVPPSKKEGYKPASVELPPGYKPRRERRDESGSPEGTGDDGRHSRATLAKIFDTPNEGTFNYFNFNHPTPGKRPIPKDRLPYDPSRTPETTPLPPSPSSPEPPHPLGHLIAYIVIFGNAHPMWDSHRELWSHTDAQKLIDDEQGLRKNFGRPIPVFLSHGRRSDPGFKTSFQGWWVLDKMRVVQPRSEEMLDLHYSKERAKGMPRIRTPTRWSASLSCVWIKTRFVPLDTSCPRFANANLPDPFTLGPGEGPKVLFEAGGMDEELRIWEEEVPTLKLELERQREKYRNVSALDPDVPSSRGEEVEEQE